MSGSRKNKVPKLKAADIRAALRKRFAQPECAIVFEVAQSTGFAANRRLDAVAMDLYPSRGLSLHGIGIKVSRGDWAREKADPAKAEQIARFCDYFWIAAPKGMVPLDELPMTWGLIEVGENGVTYAEKPAGRTDAEPIGRPFAAALLRAASRPITAEDVESIIGGRIKHIESEFEARVERAARDLAGDVDRDAKRWRRAVEALGRDPRNFFAEDDFIRAVNLVMKSGAVHTFRGLRAVERQLTEARDQIVKALDKAGVPAAPENDQQYDGRLRL